MTRIGVLSDTHFTQAHSGIEFLSKLLRNEFNGVDMIFHAGDAVDPDIYIAFDKIPFYAVRGNMDPYTPGIPDYRVIEVEGHSIGLIHGWGATEDLEERVMEVFKGYEVDAIVYGHSHYPACHRMNGILLFNPGSAIEKRKAPEHTVGILEIEDTIEGRIIPLRG